MGFGTFIVGFVVGTLIYDLLSDRKVILAIVRAFRDISIGFKKAREDINKSREEVNNGIEQRKKD